MLTSILKLSMMLGNFTRDIDVAKTHYLIAVKINPALANKKLDALYNIDWEIDNKWTLKDIMSKSFNM